jgi:hypothetical protein
VADCTFTAVANWEKVVLGTPGNATQVSAEFSASAGGANGLTDDQVFSLCDSMASAGSPARGARLDSLLTP